jgi:hypothetical protein
MGAVCCNAEYEDVDLDCCLDIGQIHRLVTKRQREADIEFRNLKIDVGQSVITFLTPGIFRKI